MTSPTVHLCQHAGCTRLCIGWLCRAHSTPLPEVAPEHQSSAERGACVDVGRGLRPLPLQGPGAASATLEEVLQGNHPVPYVDNAQRILNRSS